MITSEDINFFFGIISPKVICWFYFFCSSDIGSIPLWLMCRRKWKKMQRGKHQGKFWKPRILGKCKFECMWPRAPLHLQYIDLAKPKSRAHIFFFPHISRAQRLASARTRTRVIQLGAQCTDHWTTEQSREVGVPMVQLTRHVKSSTLYGRTVVHPNFFSLMGYYYFA